MNISVKLGDRDGNIDKNCVNFPSNSLRFFL